MAMLQMDEGFAARYVNEGFTGGEKKRLEMLQMAVLEPEMAILDETDSGARHRRLRIVAEGVNAMLNPDLGVLLITHYQRLLNYITPDVVHVLAQGRIVKSGGKDLALRLEEEGYGPILREAGLDDERRPTRPARAPGPRSRRRARSVSPWRPPASRANDDDGNRDSSRPSALLRASTRRSSGATSRSSSRSQWPPAGLPRLRVDVARSRGSSSTRWTPTTASTTPTSTAGSTRSARRRPPSTRGRAPRSPGSSTRPTPRDHLHPQRDRGDQPRRLRVGPKEHQPRRRDRAHRDGAPRQSRPVAALARSATATSSSSRSPTTASCGWTSSRCSSA